MTIHYEVDKNSMCLTPCPYRDTEVDGEKIKLGTLFCLSCIYNHGIDHYNKNVDCSYPKKQRRAKV